MKGIITTLAIFFIALLCHAQPKLEKNYTYTHYSTYDGLTQSQVTFMYQCSKGYLWICTKEGISRFDGKDFKNFVGDGLDNFNSIYDMFEHNEYYYMMASKCMYRYDGSDLKHPTEISYPKNLKIKEALIEKHLDHNTLYLFNLQNEIDKHKTCNHFEFNLNTKKIKPIPFTTKQIKKAFKINDKLIALNDSCYFIKENDWSDEKALKFHYNRFRVGANSVVGKQKKKQQIFEIIYDVDKLIEKPLNIKTEIAFHKGDYFIGYGTNQIIYADANYNLFLNNNDKIRKLASLTMITCYLKDREGNLWVGTEDGVYNFHRCLFEAYNFNVGNKVDNVWNILQDDENNMWFSGYNTGIWNLKDQNINILNPKTLNLSEWEKSIFEMQYMGGTIDSKGRAYFPFVGRILLLSKNRFKIIEQSPQTSLFLYNDEKNNRILSLGAHGNCIIEKDTWTITRLPETTATIVSCSPLTDNKFLLGSYHHQYMLENQNITALPDTFPYKGVISMASDSLGNIWKGTTSGLYLSTSNGEQRIASTIIKGNIPSVYVYRNFLFATSKNELYALNLYRYYKTGNEEVKVFNNLTGFKAMDCGQNGFFLDREGYLWFPVVDKVLRFKPEQLFQPIDKNALKTHITSFEIHSKQQNWTNLFLKNDTSLNAETDGLSFQFYTSCFNSPDKVQYRYLLKGLNDQWSEPTSENIVRYNNLKNGKYQFQVQSTIDNSNWTNITYSPIISIEKHWWQTAFAITFFLLTILLFIILLTLYIYKKEAQKHLKKLHEQKRLNELRLQSIRSKHIPHFSGNALSNIEAFIFESDLRQANKFLSKYSKMMNITLRDADKASRTIGQEIEYVLLYLELEKMRFQEKLNYQINIAEDIDQSVQLPNMLLHTWVENSIKHGLRHAQYPGMIKLEIAQQKNTLRVTVEDNGVGIEKSKEFQTQGSGSGLKILEEQLQIFNSFNSENAIIKVYDLTDKNNTSGTRFELKLPVNYQFNI